MFIIFEENNIYYSKYKGPHAQRKAGEGEETESVIHIDACAVKIKLQKKP